MLELTGSDKIACKAAVADCSFECMLLRGWTGPWPGKNHWVPQEFWQRIHCARQPLEQLLCTGSIGMV